MHSRKNVANVMKICYTTLYEHVTEWGRNSELENAEIIFNDNEKMEKITKCSKL